ncbi:MAG: orc1/cdc6 family replication initiation protein [Candidatus Aenigmarchaeota archaeon]|nr:orc1/cdc6 family replication initiation protein [Candidatus Aenigmarchaeota archaeon]
MQRTWKDIFKDYNTQQPIFKNKDALSDRYVPETVCHRDEQMKHVAKIIAPAIKGDKPSNVFVYGNTGTGKSLILVYITNEMARNTDKARVLYVNCKMKRVSDTEYRLLAELARQLGRDLPATGLPTVEVYKTFIEALEAEGKTVILILDEIDSLVKKTGDGILYNLTRLDQDLSKSKISLIGISNDTSFADGLDPRVKSSLSEEEIIFPPYNAAQLQDILLQRALLAFNDGVLGEGVIAKCAALAAQEHGDARKALALLRIAGELAERENLLGITTADVDSAEDKLDLDRVVEVVKAQPKQSQAVLAAAIRLSESGQKNIQTGDVFSVYEDVCKSSGIKMLTQRRISDLIAELDMLGIINSRVISKGRYGRTREIRILLGKNVLDKIKASLKDSYLLG